MAKTDLVSLDIKELKGFLTHIISNNRYLVEHNKPPVAIEVQGESGIGKTSAIVQMAKEMDLNFVKLNLAQIEELGDLVGFPIRQFEMVKDGESRWIDENMVEEYTKMGYSPTDKNQMSYCPPEWIANKTKGGILLLDDWNRADIRFIQAVMELIDRQQYVSWKLPQDWHIILTANPENSDYLVNSIDPAQRTRFITVNLKFDVNRWAEWAENEQLDTRCINFLLLNPELVNTEVNSRSISMFFNSISSIENFEKQLPLIQMVGEGSVGSEFSSMFSMFINNRLDKMITPQQILEGETKAVIKELKSLVGGNNNYRADIASTIATRIQNYISFRLSNNDLNQEQIESIIDKLVSILNDEILSTDICYNLVKNIYNLDVSKFGNMLSNEKLVEFILK